MKNLAFSKKFIFTLFAVLFTYFSWGQSGLSGSGTSANPFQIGSAEDWHTFVSWIGTGTNVDKYYKLTADIAVEEMVGDDTHPFSGTFDGNGKTLTVNYSGEYGLAPFYYTDGATIKNLTVTGSITTTAGGYYQGYSAGLIYSNDKTYVDRNTTIQNVTVSVNITGKDGDDNEISAGDNCGGFSSYNSYLEFEDCVYNGKIVVGDHSGGFCGEDYYNAGATFNNCIFNPAEGSTIVGGKTFGTVADASTDITGCYYTALANTTPQGALAYKTDASIPAGVIWKTVNVNNTTVKGEVTVGVSVYSPYDYTGENLASTIAGQTTVTFDGEFVSSPSQYTITFQKDGGLVSEIIDRGDYILVVNGSGTYGGYNNSTIVSVVGDLLGKGTELEPFIIATTGDWLIFANHVNNGDTYTDAQDQAHNYSEAHYKLTNNITTSTMVGTKDAENVIKPFKGTFNGRIGNTYGAYTLTFNCGSSYYDATSEEIVAPFRYTDGATITSLIVDGAIHTKVGKEAGLIGVNTHTTSRNTTVQYIINNMNFYCYEELWDAEGGGYAYDGSYIDFSYCSYEGIISTSNYHGGFCGNADNTTFDRCLFDPASNSMYWAENFVYNHPDPDLGYSTCYYTIGNNQEESTQGNMVYVNVVPEGNIGHKITTFHEKKIYEPVTVVIGGVNDTYIYTGNDITITPTVTFNGVNAITNHYCTAVISPSTVHDVGTYTLTVTAPYPEEDHDYLGTINQLFYVVSGTSGRWTALQARLNNPAKDTIQITSNITAGAADVALSIPAPRTVTIYLNGHTIDRGKSGNSAIAVINGQVLRIAAGATVTIEGGDGGTIRGGYNIAANNNENANNDGGGISNLGNLTLNNVTVRDNKCVKVSNNNTSRTARGGGIYSGKNSTLTINGGEITNNSAEGGGGGIFVYQAKTFTMNKYNSNVQPKVHSNTSKDKGGGIRVDATGSTTACLDYCEIKSNTVEYLSTLSVSNGGGIHLDAGDLTLNNCTINNNRASKFGGGIYIMGGRLYANNCSINSNMSYDETSRFDGCGGGICLLGGKCYLNGGTISGNSSSVIDGGGVYVNSGTTLSLQGELHITDNWKFISNTGGSTQATNVYLVKADGKITIAGNIGSSTIGVSKKGNTGVFTNGLNGNGTTANFSSDNSTYSIVSYNNEAKLTTIEPVTPPTTGTWNINEPVILNTTVSSDVTSIVIGNNGCLYVNTGGYINGVNIDNTTAHAENKLIINGGQVIPSNSGVLATVKKDISYALPLSQGNWYLISSPLLTPTGENPIVYNPINILDNTNLIVLNANNYPEYDLYRFNEGATQTNTNGVELQWENYRAGHVDFTTMEKGRGYLYRNYNDYTITLTGTINAESSIDYSLSYHSTITNDQSITHDNIFKGFNIIGNPYTHNISKGITGAAIPNNYLEAKYYVLDQKDGSWDLTNDGTAIPPVTGILVQAKSASTLTITNSTTVGGSKGAANNNIWFTVANSKYDDRACVEFRNGRGLNKIAHPNENVPMLYIRHNDEDFASVDMNPEAKQFDLYFEAATLGQYTLTVNPQGNYSYLHLIDKVAEEDIDLLKENEYSFIGSPSDNADRFVVRLNNSESSDNSTFAYQSGNDIVVCGEGELQVFDVMGRLVMQKHVNGVESVDKPMTTGVYILRLNENSQKIVVR